LLTIGKNPVGRSGPPRHAG